MGLFDFLKKKEETPAPTPTSSTPIKKKVVVEKPKVEKVKIIEKIGKFYRTEDGVFHKKYNLVATSYDKRPKNWIKVRVGDPVSLRFYEYKGDPAIEIIHKAGPLANIKARNATQIVSYKNLLSGATICMAIAQVRRVRSAIELNFLESEEEKIRELAEAELMMVDTLADTRKKHDDDDEDDDDN